MFHWNAAKPFIIDPNASVISLNYQFYILTLRLGGFAGEILNPSIINWISPLTDYLRSGKRSKDNSYSITVFKHSDPEPYKEFHYHIAVKCSRKLSKRIIKYQLKQFRYRLWIKNTDIKGYIAYRSYCSKTGSVIFADSYKG
jgi:hypothetical protein